MIEGPNNLGGNISREQFQNRFREKLGVHYEQALQLFLQYSEGPQGMYLSSFLVDVLGKAIIRGKVPEVIAKLKETWDEVLSKEPLGKRGMGMSVISTPYTHTEIMFNRIRHILESEE